MGEALQKARDCESASGSRIPRELRQVCHLTPPVGWMNDPNGFSVFRGEYHLFYQYHPYSARWGPMHWGHAKTGDFLRWEWLPAALAPDRDYDRDGCWSGSAVELEDGRQLLIYTGRRLLNRAQQGGQGFQVQCLAIGDGLEYEKYGGNPVLTAADLPQGCSPYDFRDPKLWREADGTFRAVTVTRMAEGDGAALLYSSPDGFSWKFEHVLDRSRNECGTMWECPDFFPLDGKQILLVSPMEIQAQEPEFHAGFGAAALLGQYDRDAGLFTREAVRTLDHGPDFYAAQTLEALDGRRILIAWMQNWASARCQPDERLCYGSMTIPRELSVREGRLIQNPVRELERWRTEPVRYRDAMIAEETGLDGIRGRVLDMTLSVRPASDDGFDRFCIHAAVDAEHRTTIAYTPESGLVQVDRSLCGAPAGMDHVRAFRVRGREGGLKVRLILDRHSLELFVNDGEQAASFLLYTPQSAEDIRFAAEGGSARVDIEKYRLEMP